MGTAKNCCRLCSLHVLEDQQLHLNFDNSENDSSDSLSTKLILFLNLPIEGRRDFSNIVCVQCANSLEFCIQVKNQNYKLLMHVFSSRLFYSLSIDVVVFTTSFSNFLPTYKASKMNC